MVFNLDFANNTILSCFFFLFLVIDLKFLVLAVISKIFNPIAELVVPIGIPSKEAKAEIEIHRVAGEAKIRKCSILFRVVQPLQYFLFINSFCSISSSK